MTPPPRSLLAVPLVLLVVACGDSGPKRPTHAEWVRQADAACTTANTALDALAKPATVDDLPVYTTQAAMITRAEEAALKALVPAKDDEARVTAFLAEVDRVAAVADQLAKTAQGKDAKVIGDFVDANKDADAKANDMARVLGLVVCGKKAS